MRYHRVILDRFSSETCRFRRPWLKPACAKTWARQDSPVLLIERHPAATDLFGVGAVQSGLYLRESPPQQRVESFVVPLAGAIRKVVARAAAEIAGSWRQVEPSDALSARDAVDHDWADEPVPDATKLALRLGQRNLIDRLRSARKLRPWEAVAEPQEKTPVSAL